MSQTEKSKANMGRYDYHDYHMSRRINLYLKDVEYCKCFYLRSWVYVYEPRIYNT